MPNCAIVKWLILLYKLKKGQQKGDKTKKVPNGVNVKWLIFVVEKKNSLASVVFLVRCKICDGHMDAHTEYFPLVKNLKSFFKVHFLGTFFLFY